MIEDLTFLEQGPFTEPDENIRKTIRDIVIKLRPDKFISEKISEFVSSLRFDESHKFDVFRKRTTSQIIREGYRVGCSDVALVYVALAREMGIPARYVETFEKEWLDSQDINWISSHSFVDLFINNKWVAYEPLRGLTPDGKYFLGRREYVEVGKGLDFTQIYLKKDGLYQPETISLVTLDDLGNLAISIRKESQ